jgi:site-specific DNA-methyltransferase (adenine-specific)
MRSIPDQSVDMILCDLPYGTTDLDWDSIIPFEPLWELYKRLVKPRAAIVLTASQPFATKLIMSNFPWFKYEWIWEKSIAGDFLNAKNKPLKQHENVLVFSSGTTANRSPNRMPYYPQGLKGVNITKQNQKRDESYFRGEQLAGTQYVQTQSGYPKSILRFPNERGLHPTQKPVQLFEFLIRTYTREGDTVLDNCCGSGTTGAACLASSRRSIQIEQQRDYTAIAASRLCHERQELAFAE